MLSLTPRLDAFRTHLLTYDGQIVVIVGEEGMGKSTFLAALHDTSILPLSQSVILSDKEMMMNLSGDDLTKEFFILDIDTIDADFNHYIQEVVASKNITGRIIYTSLVEPNDRAGMFRFDAFSFREYLEACGKSMSANLFLKGEIAAGAFDKEKSHYLMTGGTPSLLELEENEINEQILKHLSKKLTKIKPQLFKSEYELFDEFLKHLAMHTGDLFKADKLAKLMGSSRRKVHKYIEILEASRVIFRLDPFYENPDTELSRHGKIYFTDLSYLHAILGPIYYFGDTKRGILENFILLELRRKLDATHTIYFYRKKSQADLSFVLKDLEKNLLTLIDVISGSVDTVSQAIKTFDLSYHEKVERFMVLNDHIATQKSYNDKAVFFLPHISI